MPTSAAGNSLDGPGTPPVPRRARHGLGFTLIELLVVVAIIGLATAGVAFALRDTGQVALDREADRLAALLESARAQSRASGIPVRWRPTEQGFAFDGVAPGSLPDRWTLAGVSARPQSDGGAPLPALTLGPEPIIAPQQVLLAAQGGDGRLLRIASDGLRPFAVVSP